MRRRVNKNKQKNVQELSDPMTQLSSDETLKKYKLAGKITANVLNKLVNMCKDGQRVYNICIFGDKSILEEIKNTEEDGGISFPTSVSINNLAGCFSPSSTDTTVIKKGDLVKIELGAHIDGFPSLVCYTVVVDSVQGRKADVVKATAEASKAILNVMKPGNSNFDIVKVLDEYAKKYNCNLPYISEEGLAPGVMSFQISRYVIDGYNDDDDEYIHRFILNRQHDDYEFSMNEIELEEDEVYAIDIMYSTGTGRLRSSVNNTTIFKRLPDVKYMLKLKASRNTLGTFKGRFPININEIDNTRFKLGLKECLEHKLLTSYPVLEENGEYIARIKFTVIVRDTPILITGRSADEQLKKLK